MTESIRIDPHISPPAWKLLFNYRRDIVNPRGRLLYRANPIRRQAAAVMANDSDLIRNTAVTVMPDREGDVHVWYLSRKYVSKEAILQLTSQAVQWQTLNYGRLNADQGFISPKLHLRRHNKIKFTFRKVARGHDPITMIWLRRWPTNTCSKC